MNRPLDIPVDMEGAALIEVTKWEVVMEVLVSFMVDMVAIVVVLAVAVPTAVGMMLGLVVVMEVAVVAPSEVEEDMVVLGIAGITLMEDRRLTFLQL